MYAEIDKPVGLDAGAVLMLRGSSLIHKRIQDFTVEGIHECRGHMARRSEGRKSPSGVQGQSPGRGPFLTFFCRKFRI